MKVLSKEVGERVAAAIRAKPRGFQAELAKKLGLNDGTVSKWAGGRPPTLDHLRAAAPLLGESFDFLLSGEERTSPDISLDKNARPVPLAGKAAAGLPMARILEEDIPHFQLPEVFLREIYGTNPDHERAILLRVVGDSMEDDLKNGSLVFIDRGPGGKGFDMSAISHGEIYMVTPPGENGVVLKRVSIHGGFMTLESANPDRKRFPSAHYPIKGLTVPAVVRGRVVAKLQKVE